MIKLHSSHLSICVLNKGNNFCLLSKAGLSVVIIEEQYFDNAGVVVLLLYLLLFLLLFLLLLWLEYQY